MLAAALLFALAFSLTAGRFRAPTEPPPPAALEKIAAKNCDAAVVAAAQQRAESAAAAEAADRALAQGEQPAEPPIARFETAPAAAD